MVMILLLPMKHGVFMVFPGTGTQSLIKLVKEFIPSVILMYFKSAILMQVPWNCQICHSNALVTPLRKAASYEPHIAISGIWGDTWQTGGKYGTYVAVRGSYGVYVTPSAT